MDPSSIRDHPRGVSGQFLAPTFELVSTIWVTLHPQLIALAEEKQHSNEDAKTKQESSAATRTMERSSSHSLKATKKTPLTSLSSNVVLASVPGGGHHQPFKVFEDAALSRKKVEAGGRAQPRPVGQSTAEVQTDLSLLQSGPQAQAEDYMYSVDYKELAENRKKALDDSLRENEELKNQRVELVMANEDLQMRVADLAQENEDLKESVEQLEEAVGDAQELVRLLQPALAELAEAEPTPNQIEWNHNGTGEELQLSSSSGPQTTFTSRAFNMTVERISGSTLRITWNHVHHEGKRWRHSEELIENESWRHKKATYTVSVVPVQGGQHLEARVSSSGHQSILLHELDPEATYQLIVAKKSRILLNKLMRLGPGTPTHMPAFEHANSSSFVMEPMTSEPQHHLHDLGGQADETLSELERAAATYEDRFRFEELGIVSFVLFLWMCAVMLFVRRWGKIRMLVPHQPRYVDETEDEAIGSFAGVGNSAEQISSTIGINHLQNSLHVSSSQFPPHSTVPKGMGETSGSMTSGGTLVVPFVPAAVIVGPFPPGCLGTNSHFEDTEAGSRHRVEPSSSSAVESNFSHDSDETLASVKWAGVNHKDGMMQTDESHLYRYHILALNKAPSVARHRSWSEAGDSEDDSRRSQSIHDISLSRLPPPRFDETTQSFHASSPGRSPLPNGPSPEGDEDGDVTEDGNLLLRPPQSHDEWAPDLPRCRGLDSRCSSNGSLAGSHLPMGIPPSFSHTTVFQDETPIHVPNRSNSLRTPPYPPFIVFPNGVDETQDVVSVRRRPTSWIRPATDLCPEDNDGEPAIENGGHTPRMKARPPPVNRDSLLTPLNEEDCHLGKYDTRTTPV
eukprot:maker-scaffold551_size138509-snap-gene-0.23 protein:Tk04332 transcript:maker-scaffold551_size138509-snap-gene-0.23-mRNA-1 annotation:"PREDICTED: uncharacterized protein LOC103572189 isoform X2"